MNLANFQIPSMPGAVPGAEAISPTGNIAPPAGAPFPTSPDPMGGGGMPMPMGVGGGGMPPPQMPGLMSSPMGGVSMPAPQPMDPASMQYDTETQMDGTVLLRVKGPDGSKGPVIQIVKPPGLRK